VEYVGKSGSGTLGSRLTQTKLQFGWTPQTPTRPIFAHARASIMIIVTFYETFSRQLYDLGLACQAPESMHSYNEY